MAITVKYFGAIAEETGVTQELMELEKVSTVEELKAHCLTKYKTIGDLSFQIAVNQTMTASGALQDGDEVALLPPFAGG